MKEKVLITGASGFIGFHLIEAALNRGLEVYAAVRKGSETGHLKEFDIRFCELDYTNTPVLTEQLAAAGYNYIIHAAGTTRAASQQLYDTVNATYTVNLAGAAVKGLGSQLRKFVFMSSLAAIGPLNSSRLKLITEDTTPAPVTAYGRSKLLAEKKLKELSTLPLVVLRPTAVYGPRERDIFIMLRSIQRGIEPYIGRVQQRLSFVYVKDLVAVALDSLYSNLSHITFNISDGSGYDQYEFANLAKQILNKKTMRVHLPYSMVKGMALVLEKWSGWRGKTPVLNREKLNELTAINWQCHIGKAKTQLDFKPQYSLEQGLRETLQWYRLNKWL